jgi:flagellar hook protein FlgE
MDVIGNNIANVNTEAFKASSVRFSELMYQTLSSASAGNGATGTGGVNAKQIGLGVSTASTTVNITGAGSSETTGNPFDLKLSDSQTTNFFIVSDGTNTMFTRAGSFYVDGNGYLCMSSTGYTVQGWQVDASTGEIRKDTVSPLQVMSPSNSNASPEATTKAYVSGVLDKEDTNLNSDDGYVMTLGLYDSLGYNYTAKFAVTPTESTTAANGTQYHISLTDIVDSTGASIITGTDAEKAATLQKIWGGTTNGYDMVFDTNKGNFVSIGTGTGDEVPTSQMLNLAEGLGTGYTTNNADGTTTTSNFANVEVDFSSAINKANGGKSSLRMEKGDSDGDGVGKKLGALIGLAVDNSGKIYGSYDNGNTELLGQIAVAQFSNASGLEKVGSNCYQTTLNSGDFDGIGVEVDADGSKIESGELEMSNVDLSGQFTDMIITQRGFQANSRVITVSDTLLEELINLKR